MLLRYWNISYFVNLWEDWFFSIILDDQGSSPDAIKPINLSVNFSTIQAIAAVAQIARIISIAWTYLETTRAIEDNPDDYMKTVR